MPEGDREGPIRGEVGSVGAIPARGAGYKGEHRRLSTFPACSPVLLANDLHLQTVRGECRARWLPVTQVGDRHATHSTGDLFTWLHRTPADAWVVCSTSDVSYLVNTYKYIHSYVYINVTTRGGWASASCPRWLSCQQKALWISGLTLKHILLDDWFPVSHSSSLSHTLTLYKYVYTYFIIIIIIIIINTHLTQRHLGSHVWARRQTHKRALYYHFVFKKKIPSQFVNNITPSITIRQSNNNRHINQ